jgi:AcrR family transcriptional regulator
MNARANKKPRPAKTSDSRERILEAARTLFQERGYGGLSISSICDRAGVVPTSIYWHFGDKAGLLRAVIEESGGYAAQIRKAVAAAVGRPDEQLDIVVKKVRALVMSQPLGSLSFVALLSGGGPVSDELGAALAAVRKSELDAITEDFATMFGPQQGRSLALMLLAFVNYAALTFRVTRRAQDVDEILDAMRQQIRQQLSARGRG